MITPYNKTSPFDYKVRTAKERLEPAREALDHAIKLIEQAKEESLHAWDGLSEEELQKICDATEVVRNAARNAACLGISGYEPSPVWEVKWKED